MANQQPDANLPRLLIEAQRATMAQLEAIFHKLETPLPAAVLDGIANQLNKAESLAKAADQSADNDIPIATVLPPFDEYWAQQRNDVPDQSKLPKTRFDGHNDDCLSFLANIMSIAHNQKLSPNATCQLLQQTTKGPLSQQIRMDISQGKPLVEIIRTIEMRHAGIMSPTGAKLELRRLKKITPQNLHQITHRIQELALLAYRFEPDEQAKKKLVDEAQREALWLALDPRDEAKMKEAEATRVLSGRPKFTYQQLYTTLNARYEQLGIRSHTPGYAFGSRQSYRSDRAGTYHIAEDTGESSDDPDPAADGDQDEGILYTGSQHRPRRNKRDRRKDKEDYNRRDEPKRREEPRRQHDRKFRNLNRSTQRINQVVEGERESDSDSEDFNEFYAFGEDEILDAHTHGFACDGQNLILHVGDKTRNVRISPAKLNVEPDECMKCGLKGHRAFGDTSDKCPLKEYPLRDFKCFTCSKGGHIPTHCPANKLEGKPKN